MDAFRVALKRYISQGHAAPEAMKKVWRDIRAGSVARPLRGKRRRKSSETQRKRAAMKATARGIEPNPSRGKAVEIYDRVVELRAIKGRNSQYPGERFYHRFSTPAKVFGMPDGSLRIVGRGGKRLWQ